MPRPHPRTLVPDWPDTPSDVPEVETCRLIALAVTRELRRRSLSTTAAARLCGVNQVTLWAVINGRTWIEMSTLVRLEDGLGVDLWPDPRFA